MATCREWHVLKVDLWSVVETMLQRLETLVLRAGDEEAAGVCAVLDDRGGVAAEGPHRVAGCGGQQ